MANPPPTRNLIAIVFKNFLNSLRPRQIFGNLKGTDYLGTKYYEIPANPSLGKRRPSRWFVPVNKDDFQQELPAEWESWLRGRRNEPPEEEEILRNLAIMQMKKRNAAEIDQKGGRATPLTKGIETFPKRDEYELIPGKPPEK